MLSVSFIARSVVRCGRFIALMVALATPFASVTPARAATVPFTETFQPLDPFFPNPATEGAANWKVDSLGTDATWNATGGPSGGTFISRAGTPGDGPFSGPVIFRGQDSFDSSGDAFVGNWITDGVGVFSVDFFHDHSSALNVSIRFASSMNDPGASSINFLVDPGTWTTLTIPIVDSASSFQSYGSLGPVPNSTSFNTIFSDIGNIQLSLASGQVGTGLPGSVTLGIANPSIAAVPEPGTWAMAGAGAIAALGAWMRRKRGGHAN